MNNKLLNYFDYNYYISKYPDLKLLNEESCLNHLINHGFDEQRIFCKELENYNYEKYLLNNPSCENCTPSEVCLHYLEIGLKEHKLKEQKLLKYFDYNYYISKYPDLKLLNEDSCLNHLINHGFDEHRIFCKELENYNYEKYLLSNPNLKNKSENCTPSDVCLLYLEIGLKEQKLKEDKLLKYFDYNYYISKYPDLKLLNEQSCLTHLINHGFDEHRIFCKELEFFNIKTYGKHRNLQNLNILDIYLDYLKNNKNYIYFEKGKQCTCSLDRLNNTIIVVHNYFQHTGGALKFIIDIVNSYTDYNFIFVWDIDILLKINFKFNNKIILQYFIFTNITINNIIDIINNYNIKLIIPIHDFYFIKLNVENVHSSYLNCTKLDSNITYLFSMANKIICPSMFVKNVFNIKLKLSNITYLPWNDYIVKYNKCVPSISNSNKINIGMLSEYSIYKGKEYIELIKNIKEFKTYSINILIVGENIPIYDENEYFNYIKKYNLHGLFYLNKWGETHCFSLTKGLMSGLPIFYNNIGCFQERIPKKEQYFINIEKEEDIIDNIKLKVNYFKFLNYIINNNGTPGNRITIKFNKNEEFNQFLKSEKYKLYKFPIYFPQYHKIKENDYNFYNDYTDITNLKQLNNNDIDRPNMNIFNLKKLEDYNYTNDRIINKQFELLNDYKLDGFATYYYHFSKNSITNENKIMNVVINKLLNNKYNTKIFYIWANEDWSNEASLSHKTCNIENDYSLISLGNIVKELIVDFKHQNYLKINNKPVFYILHPWKIPQNQLKLLKTLLINNTINNGFSGIILKYNNLLDNYNSKESFMVHPNYKKTNSNNYDSEEKLIKLDYTKYINNELKLNSDSECIFFNFDNEVRLSKPDRIKYRTKTINNTEKEQLRYIDKINDYYKNKECTESDILLINAWNEWGEGMAIEPSELKSDFYLRNL